MQNDIILNATREILGFMPFWNLTNHYGIWGFYATAMFLVCASVVVVFVLTYFVLGREVDGSRLKGDFWAHQKMALSKSFFLQCLFFIEVLLLGIVCFVFIDAALCFGATGIEKFSGECSVYSDIDKIMGWQTFQFYDPKVPCIMLEDYNILHIGSFIVSAIVVLCMLVVYFMELSKARKATLDSLAKILDAREITQASIKANVSDENSRDSTLLHIIEEMAIASNMPMPRVFVIDEKAVNALCSGENFEKENYRVGIFVTQGAIDTFNREELQGVIGHEFSHAFHGDVEQNLKIIPLIFSLECLMIWGATLLKNRNSKADAVLFYVALVCIGFLGQLFARMIQAAISRQREFLADSASVQYTRNPAALKSALQKLLDLENAAKPHPSNLDNPKIMPYSHLCIFPAYNFFGFFDTHPPLKERIKALSAMGG